MVTSDQELTLTIKNEGLQIDRIETWIRPWGWYACIDAGPGFQVKRIHVISGACLSLQSHLHRSENWVVVLGVAEVTQDDRVYSLGVGESVFIEKGQRHRLANRMATSLEIIEVQTGSYLGEDDIVRYADIYGRI